MSSIAPNMERVVEAGETLVITDSEGQEFAVTGREAPETMEFLKAFDEWFSSLNQGIGGPVLDALFFKTKEAFNNLPMRLQRELPSIRRAGISIANHKH